LFKIDIGVLKGHQLLTLMLDMVCFWAGTALPGGLPRIVETAPLAVIWGAVRQRVRFGSRKPFRFFGCRGEGRLQGSDLSTRRRGNCFDLCLFGFVGFPITSLLTFCHVDLLGIEMTEAECEID